VPSAAAKTPDAPTAFPQTQWVSPVSEAVPVDPAEEPTRVPVPPAQATLVVPRPAPQAPVPPARAVSQPVREGKKGVMLAGLALAAVVAVVVLWQFIELLGSARGPAVAQADAASAAPAAASVPAAAPVVTQAAPSNGGAPMNASTTNAEPSPASAPAPTTASTASIASVPAVGADSRPPPGNARPVPLVVSVASAPANASTSSAAASSPARPRPGRAVPPRDEVETAAAPYAAPNATDDDARRRPAQSPRESAAAARPVPAPTFTPVGPRTATEVCGRRVFLALAICMDRECEQPAFRDQPDCKRVLEVKRQRENRENQ